MLGAELRQRCFDPLVGLDHRLPPVVVSMQLRSGGIARITCACNVPDFVVAYLGHLLVPRRQRSADPHRRVLRPERSRSRRRGASPSSS
jgi:hypothetical protein